ncbi:MAG: exonuclease SbcCD subunit D [Clostridiales bacterium]|nr:exonuclease SbcCD subunit D [Clostridiales bacterium]
MKFFHLSDLHLGKRMNEYSLAEDQAHILNEIIKLADTESPDAVVIAGDIYDKSQPSAEAVRLFDEFLCALSSRKIQIFAISGNHDSPERVAFGGRLMTSSGVYLSPVYDGNVQPIKLEDMHGSVNFYLLPFIRPINVRCCFPDAKIESYTDALRVAIAEMQVDMNERNVLITHQFVTGAERSDSEDVSVGGSDNVDAAVFDGFDYVALGHIHRPQNVGEHARYCGTPLKYSFSEANQEKSVTVVELADKGNSSIRTIPLKPLRELVELRGSYDELTLRDFYTGTSYQEDFVHITLTDEQDIPDAIGKLRTIYHNLMKLDYDNIRTRSSNSDVLVPLESRSPLGLFDDFYTAQNGQPMSDEQRGFMLELIEKIWEVR